MFLASISFYPLVLQYLLWTMLTDVYITLPYSAMVPEYWLTEGGQSATGALLDYIVQNHVAAPLLANHAASQSKFFFMFAQVYYL
jgi:hypothetical protein